jgi:hypothetical protein
MQNNYLTIDLKAFNHAMKTFKVGVERKNAKKKPVILPAMLSYHDGFLSIECDDKVTVMHANGEWHGKAQFSANVVKAFVLVPLATNPVIISYSDSKISIGATTITCSWESASQGMIEQVTNPSLIDVFAMWRTQPAEQLIANGIKQKNKAAKEKLLKATASAAKRLESFAVTQEELLDLIESKVKARISN